MNPLRLSVSFMAALFVVRHPIQFAGRVNRKKVALRKPPVPVKA
jgi:hypothetical protein